MIPLQQPDTALHIGRYSPSGKVPVLLADGAAHLGHPGHRRVHGRALPEPVAGRPAARARSPARSVGEMHSGFAALRTFMPMDFTARFGPPGKLLRAGRGDIERIQAIWADCRQASAGPGPFLFGSFTIADAMFAPVCSRFTTYAVPLDSAVACLCRAHDGAAGDARNGAAAPRPRSSSAGEGPPLRRLRPRPSRPRRRRRPRPVPESIEPPSTETWSRRRVQCRGAGAAPMRPSSGRPARGRPAGSAARNGVEPGRCAPRRHRPPEPPAPKPGSPARLPPTVEPRPARRHHRRGRSRHPSRRRPGRAAARRAGAPYAPPYAEQAPDELRRGPRPIPSTIMVKPIGDGTRRRR